MLCSFQSAVDLLRVRHPLHQLLWRGAIGHQEGEDLLRRLDEKLTLLVLWRLEQGHRQSLRLRAAPQLFRRSEAKALAVSLFQPPQDKKGEFFIESPQKIFAFLMAYGPTPEELVKWMSDPHEIDRRLKGTEHAHLIDPRAHQQRAGVLGSLGLVADSLRLLPNKGHGNGEWSATEWAVGDESKRAKNSSTLLVRPRVD